MAVIDRAVLEGLFDELFPICRSITGPGLRRSLELFRQYMPLDVETVASGTKIFDWEVPPEWRIRSARLTGPDGGTIVDLAESSLHVVNYSAPVDLKLTLDELQPHLHSLPDLPDATPYVTSYYKRTWGFCLSERVRRSLERGTYHAYIDSEFVGANRGGCLEYGHCSLPGRYARTVVLTSYLCHPSLANNELSGPLVLLGLYDRIRRWPDRRFTYRFVLNPETIGSLCYLHRYGELLRSTVEAGLVLTCLGGPEPRLSYKTTRRESALLDRLVAALNFQENLGFRIRPFTPAHGSDERQYCSPGFDLPFGQLSRTVYGEYPGYHNSRDDKAFMDVEQLVRAVDVIEHLLQRLEVAARFRNLLPFGEPQLGRRELYPSTNSANTRAHSNDALADSRTQLDRILYVLNYSDGSNDMLDIAQRADCTLADLAPAVRRLEEAGLITLEENSET